MSDPSKTAADSVRKHTVLWKGEDWERLERAASLLSEQQKIEVSPVDLIRGSTNHRVAEILGDADPLPASA